MREIYICEGTIEEADAVKLKTFKVAGGKELQPTHSYQFDARASEECPEAGEGLQVRRAPEAQNKGIPATSASKSASLSAR